MKVIFESRIWYIDYVVLVLVFEREEALRWLSQGGNHGRGKGLGRCCGLLEVELMFALR